jgi:hypothetical protein
MTNRIHVHPDEIWMSRTTIIVQVQPDIPDDIDLKHPPTNLFVAPTIIGLSGNTSTTRLQPSFAQPPARNNG